MTATAAEMGAAAGVRLAAWRRDWFSLIVLLLGVVYVAMAWTPSSYGHVLRLIGMPGDGLIAGKPQDIRSDEWSVWTPYTRIAVNNGFERFNETSPYREDLRNFNGLPLKDWALAFKPQFWPFFLTDPATAFSFSHAVFIALFLIGYHRLLLAFGFSPPWSASASLLLFFTSFVQFFWTTVGPVLAVFPWLLLAMMGRPHPALRFAAVFYLTAFWLFAHLYPPIMLSLAPAALALLAAFRPETLRLRVLLPAVAGAALAAVLVLFYLADILPVMSATVYPGGRASSGGEMTWPHALAQLLPQLTVTSTFRPAFGPNICEMSTVASWLALLLAVFADHRRLAAALVGRDDEARLLRRRLLILLVPLAALTAWQLLPVPSWAGKLLLWHKVPGARMLFATGLLILVMTLLLLRPAGLRLSRTRLAVFAALVAASLALKVWLGDFTLHKEWKELLPVAAMAALLFAAHRWSWQARDGLALVMVAVLANAVSFGGFNPLQSARPIFASHDTAVTQALTRLAERHPRRWVVSAAFPGATLNGLGHAAIGHVLTAPQLDFFRPLFPDMAPADFDQTFNRYAHIIPVAQLTQPVLPQADVVQVPAEAFAPPPSQSLEVRLAPPPAAAAAAAGSVDQVRLGRDTVVTGWAPLPPRGGTPRLFLATDLPVASLSAVRTSRLDVVSARRDARQLDSGFVLTLRLDGEPPAGARLCLYAETAEGLAPLAAPQLPGLCPPGGGGT